ncbi:hypothetical protein ACTHGU_01840 [Chitinophagaceae bacterium MMS25-I14]
MILYVYSADTFSRDISNMLTMLTKQLKALQVHLKELQVQNVKLTKDQRQLLHELNFIDNSSIVKIEFDNYSYHDTHMESFAVAPGFCPSCGKKY